MINPKAWEAITRIMANMKAAIERPNTLPDCFPRTSTNSRQPRDSVS
jgi:hypothetical protein